MAIDRNAVFDIIMTSSSIPEMMDRIDDLDDVQLVKCNDCGSIFTSDFADMDCYECGSYNTAILGVSAEGILNSETGDVSLLSKMDE